MNIIVQLAGEIPSCPPQSISPPFSSTATAASTATSCNFLICPPSKNTHARQNSLVLRHRLLPPRISAAVLATGRACSQNVCRWILASLGPELLLFLRVSKNPCAIYADRPTLGSSKSAIQNSSEFALKNALKNLFEKRAKKREFFLAENPPDTVTIPILCGANKSAVLNDLYDMSSLC